MDKELLVRILKKVAVINIPLYILNILFLITIGNYGILSAIFVAIVVLFIETLIISIFSFVLFISSREILLTNTKPKRKIMKYLSYLSYLPEITFLFRPNLEDLSQLPEFKQLFPESLMVTNLHSKYLGDGILFDTKEFMDELHKMLFINYEFYELCAGISAIYSSDDFKKSTHKKEIYIENFNEKILTFFYNTEFNIKINHQEIANKYPNYAEQLKEDIFLNKDLFLEENKKLYTYNSEYKEFFDVIFTNLENSKKKDGFVEFNKVITNKISGNKINSIDDFNRSLDKLRQ